MAKLPWTKRVTNAIDNIGTKNGTEIPVPPAPPEMQNASNADIDAWFQKWEAMRDYLRFSTVRKYAEAREKKAKDALHAALILPQKLDAGYKNTWIAGNVSVALDVRAGRRYVDEQALLTILVGDYKMSLSDATIAIEKARKSAANGMYFTPSVIE